jgi:hypothetical protein
MRLTFPPTSWRTSSQMMVKLTVGFIFSVIHAPF